MISRNRNSHFIDLSAEPEPAPSCRCPRPVAAAVRGSTPRFSRPFGSPESIRLKVHYSVLAANFGDFMWGREFKDYILITSVIMFIHAEMLFVNSNVLVPKFTWCSKCGW
ncbi:hypothetical protein AAHA92_16778 [Salvia divinorum]|uniref:Uncharacterized protein n=1 Tax=Salvia divinorum TaxID=28513 RepID=A0ABD1H0N5_SALDI